MAKGGITTHLLPLDPSPVTSAVAVALLTCSRWTLVQWPQRSLWPCPDACFTVLGVDHRRWSSGL